MASLSNNAWLCLRYLAVSVRAQMQYRVSTWMSVGGLLVITAFEYASVWILFDRFGTLRGWNLAEIAVLYGMASVSFAIAEALGRGFSGFARFVLTGEFDRILVRPRSAALQVAAQEMHLMPMGRSARVHEFPSRTCADGARGSGKRGRVCRMVRARRGARVPGVVVRALEARGASLPVCGRVTA